MSPLCLLLDPAVPGVGGCKNLIGSYTRAFLAPPATLHQLFKAKELFANIIIRAVVRGASIRGGTGKLHFNGGGYPGTHETGSNCTDRN